MPTSQPLSGQLNALGYTVYGYRYAAGHLSHLPGFNGELPDLLTGHYLLGNGYRAFNPVLMRFNSPDKLSPFSTGGLNSYAYCAGDPVNRLDPDGHTPVFIKSMLRSMGLMKKPRIPTPRPSISPAPLPYNGRLLGENVSAFDIISDGDPELTVIAHGHSHPILGARSMQLGEHGTLTPDLLDHRLKMSGVKYSDYKKMHLIVCYSGAGGQSSMASTMAELSGLTVKGYMDTVTFKPNGNWIALQLPQETQSVRKLANNTFELDRPITVHTENIFKIGRGLYKGFSYEPVWHTKL